MAPKPLVPDSKMELALEEMAPKVVSEKMVQDVDLDSMMPQEYEYARGHKNTSTRGQENTSTHACTNTIARASKKEALASAMQKSQIAKKKRKRKQQVWDRTRAACPRVHLGNQSNAGSYS
jgi:hypothetical protein